MLYLTLGMAALLQLVPVGVSVSNSSVVTQPARVHSAVVRDTEIAGVWETKVVSNVITPCNFSVIPAKQGEYPLEVTFAHVVRKVPRIIVEPLNDRKCRLVFYPEHHQQ